jgi:aerobic-type carbon monoxide dehydrogenase small subunit (CoxS/CutS family)
LNERPVEVGVQPHLLAALREELGVTSAKDGCSPSGQSGCCTALVDRKVFVSNQISLGKVASKSITALESFDRAERDRFAAFLRLPGHCNAASHPGSSPE